MPFEYYTLSISPFQLTVVLLFENTLDPLRYRTSVSKFCGRKDKKFNIRAIKNVYDMNSMILLKMGIKKSICNIINQ